MTAAVIEEQESLAVLEQNLKNAETAYARARAEAERLNRLRWSLNDDITRLNAEIKKLRLEVFEQMAQERPANAKPLFEKIDKLKIERVRLTDSLSYIASFAYEAASIRELECETAEREATARLLEGQAQDIRRRALEAVGAAARIDPGFTLNVKDARSQKLLESAVETWRTVDSLREQLKAKRDRAAREQELVAPAIFNL